MLVLGDSVAGKMGIAMRYRQDEFHAFVAERSVGDCSILTRFGLHPDGVGAEETARWTFGRISSVLAERRDGPVGAKSAERSLLER